MVVKIIMNNKSKILKLKSFGAIALGQVLGLVFTVKSVSAQIFNPAIGESIGGSPDAAEAAASGEIFARYFVNMWNTLISVGGIAVLIFFLWGALEWITAGGDSSKIEKARNKITQSIVGLVILVSSFTILAYLGQLLFGTEFSILQFSFQTPGSE
jgi:hypothetical protein